MTFYEEHYEIIIRLGAVEHVIPARIEGIDGAPWVTHYTPPGERENTTGGAPDHNAPEHTLTRAALNVVGRLLSLSRGGQTWGLPARPLALNETLTVQIRRKAEEQ